MLRTVILGTGESMGGTPLVKEAYDPKSKEHIRKGTFPKEKDVTSELNEFELVLKKYGVEIYRPQVIRDCNQVFARDIGFVIEDKFIIPQILWHRRREIDGIEYIIDQIGVEHLLIAPNGVRIEGGDVMPWHDHLLIGYSKHPEFSEFVVSRTNEEGVEFLRKAFPHKKVRAFELKKSDTDAMENALHLDCCFQPIGTDMAIIYPGGFKQREDYVFLETLFGPDKLIEITKKEMYDMNSNVFSISPDVIVSENRFTRLNGILREKGFTVETVNYSETAKMEGLLRCSTLPLLRDKKAL
ncbi:MAG: arginine deiminase family protein [Cyclobacteriaceae bacterium]